MSTSATSTTGIDSRVVTMNEITASIRPPKYPASTPSVVPITQDSATTENPTNSEIRAP